VQIDPRAPLGYECLGLIYLDDLHRYDDALGNYRKVIELRPLWETGYVGVGRVFIEQRNYAEAEKILRQGVDRVTEPTYINYWLGLALYRQERYEEAQPQFEKATQLAPDNPGVHFWLGLNLEKLQRYPEARTAYERAVALDPNYQEANDALERLRRQGY
jgi:eukaryotic-like serine/threonine-protein kinase